MPAEFATRLVGLMWRTVYGTGVVQPRKAVVNGEYDHLPEGAFYMVGDIEEVIAKAERMAAAAA